MKSFKPNPAQTLAIKHLVAHERAALFMGLGLGKTAAALYSFLGLQALDMGKGVLVVAPRRVADLSWPNEIAEWEEFKGLKVVNLRQVGALKALKQGKADIYLINSEQLPKLVKTYLSQTPPHQRPFDHIIVDELTKAKNPKSKRFNALRPYLPARRWGLTGTPNPNSLMELFGQIRLLDDGARLGKSFDAFKRAYFYPTDYMEYNWEPFDGAEEKIYAKLQDICCVLRSEDYSGIPDPILEDVEVSLPPEALKDYKELEKELLLGGGDDIVMAQNAATLVNKLLQITGGAVYCGEDNSKWRHVHGAKLLALRELIKKHQTEPVLIACNYRHEKERILKDFPDAVIFPEKNQEAFLAKWNAGKIPLLVADPRSLGHGLNMQHGGRVVVWFSPNYSRELYDQLNARLARQGQVKRVLVYRILCPGTIDDAVVETLRKRDEGQKALLSSIHNLRRLKGLI